MSVPEDVEKVWQEFWLSIVMKDGVIDMDQIKRELFDYHTAIEEVGKVYDELTMGRFTKPNTAAHHVIDAVEEVYYQ